MKRNGERSEYFERRRREEEKKKKSLKGAWKPESGAFSLCINPETVMYTKLTTGILIRVRPNHGFLHLVLIILIWIELTRLNCCLLLFPSKREKTLPVNKSISLVPYHTGIDTFEVPDLVQWPQQKEEDYAVHIEACRN